MQQPTNLFYAPDDRWLLRKDRDEGTSCNRDTLNTDKATPKTAKKIADFAIRPVLRSRLIAEASVYIIQYPYLCYV